MVKPWEKLVKKIVKSGDREDLADKVNDILINNLENYDIKSMEGNKNQFRVRVGDYRIIFEKTQNGNKIIQVNKRGDIYKTKKNK